MDLLYDNLLRAYAASVAQATLDTGAKALDKWPFATETVDSDDDDDDDSFVPTAEHFDYLEIQGPLPPLGKRIRVRITGPADLQLVVLKSDTTLLAIPELTLESPPSTGRYTILENFLSEMRDALRKSFSHFPAGAQKEEFRGCLDKLDLVIGGQAECTLLLDDPIGLARVVGEKKLPNVSVQWYERTWSQREEFGLNHPPQADQQFVDEEGIAKLSELVAKASKIVFLTGAGVSTESGIPAYRGNVGLVGTKNIWDQFDPRDEQIENFLADENCRARYWRMHQSLEHIVKDAKPNSSHYAPAELARRNKLLAVLTQNIDGLYLAAGCPPDRVVELHGTATRVRCFTCKKLYSNAEAFALLRKKQTDVWDALKAAAAAEGLPTDTIEEPLVAPYCECGGPLKQDTISFGQPLEEHVLARARAVVKECDLLIVMGTSLTVFPVASFPTLGFDNQVPVAVINRDETRYDLHATVRINNSTCAESMRQVLAGANLPCS
eukprot:TRINITY_DN2266_c2_g1_i2.p1 TRINITY_DN2266_c2_g1~~TRINITY_DN2266_c2_g1_i2.p1  ORF type:complete len:495 (-),score=94.51 TRINITY_DN2266_c2_g1_i2:31-1515(-)